MSLAGASTLDPVPLCAALADESRWQILRSLGHAERSASELARDLPISRQAIAKHLTQLESVGLVEGRREGRHLRYHALGSQLSLLAEHLQIIGRGWEQRLERLRQVAEALTED